MIKLKRYSGFVDKFRKYYVLLDGEIVAEIADGKQIEIEVQPGNHSIALKLDWAGSNSIEFESVGTTVEFECGSNLRGMKIFLLTIYTIFMKDKYLWIKKAN